MCIRDRIIDRILNMDTDAKMEDIDLLEKTATAISVSADCAIGSEAAKMVLRGLEGYRKDFESHIKNHTCALSIRTQAQPVPCVAMCPAGVDVPGYISLLKAGRYDDAVRPVSYTHLRAHETGRNLVCRLLLEKKKKQRTKETKKKELKTRKEEKARSG